MTSERRYGIITMQIEQQGKKGVCYMNDKNTEMFFGDEEEVVLTLTDEDGEEMEAQMLAAFEIEEMSAEYVAVLPLDGNGEMQDGEVVLFRYDEDEEGNPEISAIEDENEYEIAAEGFRQLLKSGAIEGFDCSDDEEEDEEMIEEDYLDDIGSIFPGISIEKE